MFYPEKKTIQGVTYDWSVDVIENWGYDEDGVAYASGELSRSQYAAALAEGDVIVVELYTDIEETEVLCQKLLSHVNERIEKGEDVFGKNTQVGNGGI